MRGHGPGGVCVSTRPYLDREVLAAIDGLGPGRWRYPLRDVQLGKLPLKGPPEDAIPAPSSQPHAAETR
jgi:hypothetical protein